MVGDESAHPTRGRAHRKYALISPEEEVDNEQRGGNPMQLHPRAGSDTGFKNAVADRGAKVGIDVDVTRKPGVRALLVAKGRWVVERSIG